MKNKIINKQEKAALVVTAQIKREEVMKVTPKVLHSENIQRNLVKGGNR